MIVCILLITVDQLLWLILTDH